MDVTERVYEDMIRIEMIKDRIGEYGAETSGSLREFLSR
jgi:hypothetical protein